MHVPPRARSRTRELQLLRNRGGIDRIWDTRQRTGAERRDRRAFTRFSDPRAVASKSLDVREKVMRQRDRLRALQVCVAGEDRVDLERCALDERQRE
jgi:phosphoglycerate dehydrogenase-like enzyme